MHNDRIEDWQLFRFTLPLDRLISWGGQTHHARSGLLLRLVSNAGEEGWGEVAPLAGHSRESLSLAHEQLLRVLPGLVGAAIRSASGESGWYPSVQFGIDQALAALRSGSVNAGTVQVSVCGLITGLAEHQVSQAQRMVRQGYKALKIKVGKQSVSEDIQAVGAIARACDGVALRLDANRAWTLDEARSFLAGIEHVAVDFLEEPLGDIRELARLAHGTRVPLALDESLLIPDGESHPEHVAVHVLKPSLLGGRSAMQVALSRAETFGARVVISTAFESGIGMQSVLAYAAALPNETHGLGTYRYLVKDVLKASLPVVGPRVSVTRRTVTLDDIDGSVVGRA